MSKKNKKLAPELRFPEFIDKDPWKLIKMSEVLSEHGLKSDGTEEVFSVSVNKGLVNQVEHLGRSFSASNTDKYKKVLTYDIVYTKSPTGNFPFGIIKQSKIESPAIVSPLYGVFSPKTTGLGKLMDAYFESPGNTKVYLEPLVQKGAKNTININNKKFLSGRLPLPSGAPEQHKLGKFLDSIDELIKYHSKKIDALCAFKTGLVQQLFPARGHAVPKLRFPEFKKDGDWKGVKAGQLFFNRTERGKKDLPIYSVTMNNGMVPRASLDRKIEDVADSSANKKVQKGDIVYNMMRMWQGALGVASEECMVSPAYVVLKPNSNVDSTFFYYLFKRFDSLQILTAFSRGLTKDRLRLYYDDFSKIPILYPSLPEQEKIGKALSDIDVLIKIHRDNVFSLKCHKKGLVQKLFPVMDDAV